jgi:CRISPR-associated endonuclease/helicase Cas3
MNQGSEHFWAKTIADGRPGICVRDHCLNVGSVASAILQHLPTRLHALLPCGTALLAALHDIGKITLGFQVKCPTWPLPRELDERTRRSASGSVSDHALASQVYLQNLLKPVRAQLWAAAVGAHHGRPKGRTARIEFEAAADWAEAQRKVVADELIRLFGPLPATPPDPRLAPAHSDLWLLAGLITVADWIGSNEAFFSPEHGVPIEESRKLAKEALAKIGWPGGKLRATDFQPTFGFPANSVQQAVASAAPGLVIVEAPMGCGKTEAALHAAQRWIAADHHHGFYFALPTQVTSNRIHQRVAGFLNQTLDNPAHLRLAHGHAWLHDAPVLKLSRTHDRSNSGQDADDPAADLREARSWFASGKQALLAPYGVGTIDQALQGMVTVKHFFVRRFALAGKVVILDEIHSYDVYTGTLVGALVRELLNLGCSVIILSATLTAGRRKELLAAAGCTEEQSPDAYPLVTTASPGGAVEHLKPEWTASKTVAVRAEEFPEEDVLDELIRRAEAGQHVLWIRNTVIEAQQAFRALRDAMRECDVKVGLLHARFPFERRQKLEHDWLGHLGKDRAAAGPGSILIATQVVEQSVDIDLDFIVSDLAPTDMLVQRMGRLWRHERPAGHRTADKPEFWIRLPQLGTDADAKRLKAALGRSGKVYAPYVLLRSAAVWRHLPVAADVSRVESTESWSGLTSAATKLETERRSHIHLPSDIRTVLEATYAAPGDNEPDAWRELREELEAEKRTLAQNAEAAMRVFGLPMLNPDDDGALTRRKGPPTVPLVLLHSVEQLPNGKGWKLTAANKDRSTSTVSDFDWSIDAARFLHHWLARAPKWQVPADAPRPRWLAEHVASDAAYAIVAADGRLIFGDEVSDTSYHPDFGVFADQPAKSRPQPEPEPWSEDDDEFDQ